uniref:Uncharacterized protein n=1 Tax=Knipowitschia caucasica TaxID=637954 RepID=A0AAV2LZZ9_KNICA
MSILAARHPWKLVPSLKVSLPPHQPFCGGHVAHKAAGGCVLATRGAGRIVIDHHSPPNYLLPRPRL